ncbi:ABC transporter permease [Chryseolinea sp. T2]|uniref:ABC transporter permease n=1 Tax=Chryseolinea sp. T2 TaxID=3129255 RepID=UPI003077484C
MAQKTNSKDLSPPRAASRLLLSFLRDDLAEDVSGDLEERFYNDVLRHGSFKAKVNYWYQVINYLRPFAFKKIKSSPQNNAAMVGNYFKIGWRNLVRQRMYSFIKIGGFAMGIAACLLIAIYIQDELSYDRFYKDGNRIYRVYENWNDNGKIEKGVWFQAPFAKALKEDYPEIEKAGRYNSSELFGGGPNQIRPDGTSENFYEERFVFADQELLEILEVKMVYGDLKHSLDQPQTIVLTRSKAEKYFPGENPVGKLMVVNDNTANPFKIGGVIEDFSPHSHFQHDFIMTMTGREFWWGEQNYWGATNYPTYVLLREGTNPEALAAKLQKVVDKYMLPLWIKDGRSDAKDLASKISFGLQPIRDIHLETEIHDPVNHGDRGFVWLFGAIASFILIIACVNFINLATAKSANRAKEVGLRKTVGSYRSNIVTQFLTESVLFSAWSFVFGIVGAWLLLPYFNDLADKSLTLPFTEWWFVPAMIVGCMAIGVLAGIYPSLYLSSFRPAQVLKGNLLKGSKGSSLRSALVIFQFTTSIVLIISTVIIYRQMGYVMDKKVGYDKEQVLLLQGTRTIETKLKTLKEELVTIAAVKSASISDYLPVRGTKRNGNRFWNEGREKTDPHVGGQFWVVDEDYITTMGMKLVEGRDFARNRLSDTLNIIINQSMAHELGLKEPLGKRIVNYRPWNIIGVVEDFNFESLRNKVEPLAMIAGISPGIVSVKLNTRDVSSTIAQIEKVWDKFSPNQKIRYSFLDETYARMYDDVQRMGRIFTTFAAFAIIVACLGLFALSAFMVEQRSKEISIRLVLGASMNSILRLLTLNFVGLVLISLLLASPIGWYMMREWLQDFEYQVPITWDVFVVSGILALAIALGTISYQCIRAALAKPVEGLRSE